jgi:beta-mannosidase
LCNFFLIAVHHFNYEADGWDPLTYPQTRFASAFGFQSYPSIKSLKTVAIYDDLFDGLSTNFIAHRQHHPKGDTEMKNQIKYRLLPKYDDPSWRWPGGLEIFSYLSQVC